MKENEEEVVKTWKKEGERKRGLSPLYIRLNQRPLCHFSLYPFILLSVDDTVVALGGHGSLFAVTCSVWRSRGPISRDGTERLSVDLCYHLEVSAVVASRHISPVRETNHHQVIG